MELLHWADEMVDATDIRRPGPEVLPKKELDMAAMLIESMAEPWKADAWKDDYSAKLLKLIDAKVKAGGKTPTAKRPMAHAGNVIDLADALAASLKGVSAKKKKPATPARKKAG